MRPVLGVQRTERMDEASPKHHYLDFQVDLTQEEFEQYLRANADLCGFLSNAQLFVMAVLNYQEYYDTLRAYVQTYIQRCKRHFDTRHAYIDTNRCLLNWLSSVRTYLDHTESRIKRQHGEASHSWQRYEESCRREYDGTFSYRFLYKMRNYAQHCGFPIHRLGFASGPSESDPKKPAYSIEVECSRDELLSKYDGWGSQLREEISGLPSAIDINLHVNAMMDALERINSGHMREEFSMLRESALFVRGLLQRISPGEGKPGVFEIEVVEDETGQIKGISQMVDHSPPVGLVDAIIDGKTEDVIGEIVVETV